MIKVVDNVLGKNALIQLGKMLEDTNFPWYWQSDTNFGVAQSNDITKTGFRHCFIREDKSLSDYSVAVMPIVCAMADAAESTIVSIFSVHANLLLNHNKEMALQPHVDIAESYTEKGMPKYMTGIFYLDTVDGDTVFFDSDQKTAIQNVSPMANRMVIFDATIFHSASSPMTGLRRRVINVNVLVKTDNKEIA